MRADNWWWGTGISGSSAGCETNYNWNTFIQDINGATVLLTAKREGYKITINHDITTARGDKYYYKLTRTSNFDNTLRFFFTNEKSHQDFQYVRIEKNTAIAQASITNSKQSMLKIYTLTGQEATSAHHGIIIKNGKKIIQK